MKITALVENRGSQDYIGLFNVSFQMDGLELGTITAPRAAQPLLRAGETAGVPFHWFATTIGPHQLSAVVDPDDHVRETDENNNIASITLIVSEKRLVFTDDFGGRLDRWDTEGDWEIGQENGNLFLIGRSGAAFVVRDLQVRNFALEFDVRLRDGGFGVLFRLGPWEAYEFGIVAPGDEPSYLTLWHHPGEHLTEQGISISSPDAWHHLTLVMFEDTILVYMDDEVWVDHKDEHPLLESGGLRINVGQGEVWFDNVQVISLGG
jgi:hypothetical protein